MTLLATRIPVYVNDRQKSSAQSAGIMSDQPELNSVTSFVRWKKLPLCIRRTGIAVSVSPIDSLLPGTKSYPLSI